MSDLTAEQTFRRIEEHVLEKQLEKVVITFHGGEPLLAGVERFERYVNAAKSQISANIEFTVQTNGTLLTEEFLDLFVTHDVKIGMSLDGDRAANDRYRRFKNGKSSFDRVLSSVRLINSKPDWARLLTGYLAVVDLKNDPREVFDFISGIDSRGFDVLLPDCNHESPPERPSTDVGKTAYGQWMSRLFDVWLESGIDIEICYIEEIMAMLFGQRSTREHIGSQFADLIIVESDGDIEGLDTLKMVGRDATHLGLNVHQNSFTQALEHESIACRLVGYEALCAKCRSCSFLQNCGGGYIPHRYKKETGFLNPSVYCHDIQYLVTHIRSALVKELKAE